MKRFGVPAAAILLVSGCLSFLDSGPSPDVEAMDRLIDSAVEHIDSASGALGNETYAQGRSEVYRARADFTLANAILKRVRPTLDDADARYYSTSVEIGFSMVDALLAAISWGENIDDFVALTESNPEETEAVLYGLEALVGSGARVARDFDEIASKVELVVRTDPTLAGRLEVDEESVEEMRAAADVFEEADVQFAATADELRNTLGDVYIPEEERAIDGGWSYEFPSSVASADLLQLFDGFDANADNEVDISEAKAFYFWIEDNIQYRYDDENEPNPVPGNPVGDGRDGDDYHQTPQETFQERLGDCEDQNLLEVAFYNYYGVDAYEAYVNAQDPNQVDHAIAIVRVAGTADEFSDLLGGLNYYTFEDGNEYGIPPGVYMIVDNTYSQDFGFISDGVGTGQFRIFQIKTLGEELGEEIPRKNVGPPVEEPTTDPTSLAEWHTLAEETDVSLSPGGTWYYTFQVTGTVVPVEYDYGVTDYSSSNVGFIRHADLQAFHNGQSVDSWGWVPDTQAETVQVDLEPGEYDFIVDCLNTVYDCNFDYGVYAYFQ